MKTALLAICGEADHPLLKAFWDYYNDIFDEVVIQYGCTDKWIKVNGNTSGTYQTFTEKVDQQNAGLEKINPKTEYLFTFDVDEFVSTSDMHGILSYLGRERPDQANIQFNQFWHKQDFVAYGGDGWGYEAWNPRVWRYVKGMKFVNHRPPTPSYAVRKVLNLPQRGNHYSYVYPLHVMRKMAYYGQIYPHMDYDTWLKECYLKWTPETRDEIEAKWSIHPSTPNAKTKPFTGKHFIEWK